MNYASYAIESGSRVTVVMPDGRRDEFNFDGITYRKPFGVFNTLTKTGDHSYTLTFLDGTVYTYAIPAGTNLVNPFLTEIRDARNQPLTIEYDATGRLWKVRDALNRETVFSYNAQNLVETVIPSGVPPHLSITPAVR